MTFRFRSPDIAACRGRADAVLGVALFAAASVAIGCGFEDPGSIGMRRGMLNISYPQSLHVGTAIWQAQLAGALPRDPLTRRDDLTPEARAALQRVRASAVLARFAARLSATAHGSGSLAVVLLDSVMWSRFELADGVVRPVIHVPAPAANDVVVVTDTAVLEAIAAGDLDPGVALDQGLMRLYGTNLQVEGVRAWLTSLAPG